MLSGLFMATVPALDHLVVAEVVWNEVVILLHVARNITEDDSLPVHGQLKGGVSRCGFA